ncbi:unnamed protein product, partial [Brassica oleracea]
TGKWEQEKLLRLKAKYCVAKGEVKDAIVTYTQLLALLQVQSKSLSSAKKMPKVYDVDGLRSLELGTWHDLALIYINLSQWRDAETCLSRSKTLLTLTWILILVFENDGNFLQTRCIRKEGCLIISGRCVFLFYSLIPSDQTSYHDSLFIHTFDQTSCHVCFFHLINKII